MSWNDFVRLIAKEDPSDRLEVEIGDSKQETFYPQLKLLRWDNEVNASFRLSDFEGYNLTTEGEKTKLANVEKEVHFYEKPKASKEGGYEFEIMLKEHPISNIIEFTLQTKGIRFYYQPIELSAEEIARGVVRADNVKGSYAVYHATKKNHVQGQKNYRAGKAFHIYRPKIIDLDGGEIWGELKVDEGTEKLLITINQSWLDNAVYPVIVDPTFGYTTVGEAKGWGYSDYQMGSWAEATGGNGTGDKISVWIDTFSPATVDLFNCHLYAYVADDDVGNAIANGKCTERADIENSGDWEDFVFPTSPTITDNTKYFICGWSDDEAGGAYDTVSNKGFYKADTYDNDWDSPITGETGVNNIFSIYCTYSAAAAGNSIPYLTSKQPQKHVLVR